MKSEAMKLCRVGALAGLTALLVACGDDVTNTDVTNVTGAKTVADLAAAGKCDDSSVGEIVLNADDGALYVCNGKKWTTMKGDAGDAGEAGASCTGRSIAGVGVEITCGGVVIDTITAPSLEICGNHLYDVNSQFCDGRDSTIYNWVKIGSQIWMAENLNYADSVRTSSLLGKSWCYNNSTDSCAKYGRLYTWAAAMDTVETGCGTGKTCAASAGRAQGICPDGWHLPDSTEWMNLRTTVQAGGNVKMMLKAAEGWSNGKNGTDNYGFSGLPAGYYGSSSGTFWEVGETSYIWSSTARRNKTNAYTLHLDSDYTSVPFPYNLKMSSALSVRCVKN